MEATGCQSFGIEVNESDDKAHPNYVPLQDSSFSISGKDVVACEANENDPEGEVAPEEPTPCLHH